jgi:hypothetical protein
MERKEFTSGGKTYRIELLDVNGEIRVFEHIRGRQKEVIVEKLNELMTASGGAGFDAAVVQYVSGYATGHKDASHTTRSLGKVLFDRL